MLHHAAIRPQVVIIQGGRAQEDAYAWVEYLNGLLAQDPDFMAELVNHRPRCNYKIATHPTVQVMNLNQLDEILADLPPAEPESVPYDNHTRHEDGTPPPAGAWRRNRRRVVYENDPPDQVASPSRDSAGRPVMPGFNSAMNKSLDAMPKPRWATGMLGVINGMLGIGEKGQGPIAAETDMETGRISKFFVTEPYERTKSACSSPPADTPEKG